MTAHEWPPGVRDSSCSFPARLSTITPLSVFKKLEDQASNRKILRKEAHLLCSPRRKQELDPAFQMPHPIPHTDDIYSYSANMRNARALILTDTRVHMFFNAENLESLWKSGRRHSAPPTTKPVTGLFVTSLFLHKTHRHKPNPLLAEMLKTVSNEAIRGTVARTKWTCSFHADEQLCNLMNALDRHMDSNTIKVYPFLCLAKWTETRIMVAICGLEDWLQNQNLYQTKSHVWDFF